MAIPVGLYYGLLPPPLARPITFKLKVGENILNCMRNLLGLLWFCYSVSVGFSQKTVVSVFSRFRFLQEIWVKQTINCKRNNVIREPPQIRSI